ncbi:uncharacterized protein LOC125884164 isoform X1 [Epinephelus fuscoguttatus]|uniref:uncharacterized protein LOC125884164 isoform X1 n=1 Tax=Epinephelus fuscoguttatus TaxID=293821 RepID=UPI0020D1523F|nr:uncharacterized protein LOC125884164 isoform X1 [Epinephelus fuscoguttatus]
MYKVQMLRALVKQRLTAAAEEIFGLVERTIAEYEEELCRSKEENERQRKLLDAVLNPQLRLHRADAQQLLVVKEEVPPEQQKSSSSVDQEDPEPPHIKGEQEELWISQEGEQLQGLEEIDITKFISTPVPVKSDDDEEKPQSSQLHQRHTGQMETEAEGEDCGGAEPARNSDPDTHLQPETDDETGESSEPETDDSDDWTETREPQSGLGGRLQTDQGSRQITDIYSRGTPEVSPATKSRKKNQPEQTCLDGFRAKKQFLHSKTNKVRARKTTNGLYSSPTLFAQAHQAVCKGRTVRGAAALFGVPYSTLYRYIKIKSVDPTAPEPGYKPHNKVFSAEQESSLRDYLLKAADIYYGLSSREVRSLAYQLAKKHDCSYPKAWDVNQLAGRDWSAAFLHRNPQLLVRRPQATSLSRATSFNPSNVGNFFSKLSKVLDRHHFQAKDVWNVDDSSTVNVQVPDKVLASRGTKQVGSTTSAERGTFVTMALAVNAMGNSIPPHFVFPCKTYHDHFVRDGPTGCTGSCSESGWMQESDFLIFLKHFIHHTKASADSKVLLLLDNHTSHLSLEGIDYCRANGVVLLSFPPHCSHKLQPVDRSVYEPLKRCINSAMDQWMVGNPGKKMTIYDLPGIVATALPSAVTPSNIVAGFRCTGIWPFNPSIFTEEDFSPAYVTV